MSYDFPTNSDDIIDLRGVMARIDDIEGEQDSLVEEYKDAKQEAEDEAEGGEWHPTERLSNAINALSSFWDLTPEEIDNSVAGFENEGDSFKGDEEAAELREFIEQFRGYGGDEQWEGSWFPVTAIRDSYFEDYARELAEDIGAISGDEGWPLGCIDWEKAARELQMDYTSAEFDGVTYWAR